MTEPTVERLSQCVFAVDGEWEVWVPPGARYVLKDSRDYNEFHLTSFLWPDGFVGIASAAHCVFMRDTDTVFRPPPMVILPDDTSFRNYFPCDVKHNFPPLAQRLYHDKTWYSTEKFPTGKLGCNPAPIVEIDPELPVWSLCYRRARAKDKLRGEAHLLKGNVLSSPVGGKVLVNLEPSYQPGDSGSGVFQVQGGELVLVGVALGLFTKTGVESVGVFHESMWTVPAEPPVAPGRSRPIDDIIARILARRAARQ